MTHSVTVRAAYGRDYKSQKEIKADWEAGKDFMNVGIYGGGYINREDAKQAGIASITVRFKQDREICVIKVK